MRTVQLGHNSGRALNVQAAQTTSLHNTVSFTAREHLHKCTANRLLRHVGLPSRRQLTFLLSHSAVWVNRDTSNGWNFMSFCQGVSSA
jgi:hypothetical protein